MPDIAMVNIKINGIAVQAPVGESVIEAAKRVGVDVPFFCYHPRLEMEDAGANCRMCLVDVALPRRNPDGSVVMSKMPKPQTACSLPVSEGMEVETESEQVVSDRRGILEFLLINHPLDCPICDRGGECPLQNNAIHYGSSNTRFIEEKRHFPKAFPLSEFVVFDRERCIHCARCTRFTTDISGDAQLNFLFRGGNMEVSTFGGSTFESRFSGNVIELCPVGALLSREYRFKARPWDIITQKSICTECGNGCNIKLDSRASKLQRVNARINEAVNEEWTCDRGKFGMDYVSASNRVKHPLIRKGNQFVPSTWEEANTLIVSKLREAGSAIGGIGGDRTPNEDLYVWQRFFREYLGSNNLDYRMGPNFSSANVGIYGRFGYRSMGNSLVDLQTMQTILVFGSNLVDEHPIMYLRVRKAWKKNRATVVEANPATLADQGFSNHVSEFSTISLRYVPGSEFALACGLINAIKSDVKDISEQLNVSYDDLAKWSVEAAAKESGVCENEIRRAAKLLSVGKMAIIAGDLVQCKLNCDQIIDALGDIAVLTGNSVNMNIPLSIMNAQGAQDMGILPDSGPGYERLEPSGMNTEQMLRAAVTGELKLLWIVNSDPVRLFHDPALARQGLENCAFTVVNAHTLNDTAMMADVVLPVETIAERDGSITNVERRVQRFHKAFEISPDIHADWQVFQEIGARMGNFMPYFSVGDISHDIVKNVPIYANCGLPVLGDEGVRWEYPQSIEAVTVTGIPVRETETVIA